MKSAEVMSLLDAIFAEPAKPRVPPSRWTDEALVLLITETKCNNCGAVHTAPNRYLMLQRFHPTSGLKIETLTTNHWSELWLELPKRQHRISTESVFCHECFTEQSDDPALAQLPIPEEESPEPIIRSREPLSLHPQFTNWSIAKEQPL